MSHGTSQLPCPSEQQEPEPSVASDLSRALPPEVPRPVEAPASPAVEAVETADAIAPADSADAIAPAAPADASRAMSTDGPGRPASGRGLPLHTGKRPPRYPPHPLRTPSLHDGDEVAAFNPHVLLDGCTEGHLTVRAASVRGDSHNWEGTCRQDSMLVTRIGPPHAEMLLLAVADGVGSAAYSHSGSYVLSRMAATYLHQDAESIHTAICTGDLAELGALANKSFAGAVSKQRASWERRAASDRLTYSDSDYATTLHVLLVPTDPGIRDRALFGVGDGGLISLRQRQWLSGDEGAGGILDTRTEALPHAYRTAKARLFRTAPGDVLLLGTDGITNPLMQKDPEFAQILTAAWCSGEIPSMSDFLWQLQTRAVSYDDDRTAICLWEGTP
ncbi:protein phosphatase 2C domain-containing protein [Streptomyces sp. NBC_00525]|uniref:protein phosphatase 2C domain-containing protein n=1 Tax=Streptomyces sp. NBC_00525 TaxID=2903660 RepID=UPI002E816CCC|nr:protein phosphatase 2C domain-containing protein [Streptomyces sp. NBC_00525]WUC94720.1 protein phosphatase 2C domain-containing protein [Streptomyces sp. NBC_00525]